METDDLINEWNSLSLSKANDVTNKRPTMVRRLEILHRLNELSVTAIRGQSIVELLEENNSGLRAI
jgi:hypothetical protein